MSYPRGLRLLIPALILASAAAGAWLWWRGRPERHLAEAGRLLDAGAWSEAIGWIVLPESTPATREHALILRARIALAAGRPNEAVGPLRGVNLEGPMAAEAAFWKGRALYAVGNTPQAIAWFRAALARRPRDPDSLRWLASAAYDLGDRQSLRAALRTLTEVAPDDSRAWRTLGLVTLEEPSGGELERSSARLAYETSLRLDPAQPDLRLELAGLLIDLGEFDEAGDQLRACEGRVPEADRADRLARIAWEAGDADRCRALVDAGLKANPGHTGLLARRALLAQAEGHPAEAVAWLDRVVAADPYNARWVYMRGSALRASGRSAEAARDAALAAELKRANLTMSELNDQAARYPVDPGVRLRLGQLCESLGKPELAASWYRAALACDPRSAEARAALSAVVGRDPPTRAMPFPGAP